MSDTVTVRVSVFYCFVSAPLQRGGEVSIRPVKTEAEVVVKRKRISKVGAEVVRKEKTFAVGSKKNGVSGYKHEEAVQKVKAGVVDVREKSATNLIGAHRSIVNRSGPIARKSSTSPVSSTTSMLSTGWYIYACM